MTTMRLICPNCGAEYEVDAAAVPVTGRDVQCSNCGHAWYQYPPDVEAAQEAEAEAAVAPELVAAVGPVVAAPVVDEVLETADEPPAPPAAVTPRVAKTLDETVMAVLREEAEREVIARRAEARPIETQAELGLEAGVATAAVSAARVTAPAPEEPVVEHRAASRRDLLPDIEEINSTLRATSERGEDADEADEPPSRNGFRSGFVLMMVVLVVLSLTYTMAPRIAAQMPGTAPALQSYVRGVDSVRLWLDGLIRSATGAVQEVSPETSG